MVTVAAVVAGGACGPSATITDGDTDAGTGGETGVETATVGVEGTSAEEGPGEGPDDSTADGPDDTGPAQTNLVDIMFVIDNSGTMGEEQSALALAAASLVDTLDGVGIDYRIGMTTTDNGNPWCSGTTPEGGQFRLSSCLGRIAEFQFQGAETVDASDLACRDICGHETITITPTTNDDDQSKPRPWIEVSGGVANVDVPVAEALACALPQGINGCGFEQQLESMYKAIARSQNNTEDAFGFFRTGALPVIIIVTDEADCSYSGTHETIFLPDGDRTFWSLPDEGAPTSAVCWNAGVSCVGGDCAPANYDALGNPTDDSNAVMQPVSRYVEGLEALELTSTVPGGRLLLEFVGGVSGDGSVVYQPASDPGFEDDFGIGPGCEASGGPAVPPVRQRAVAEAFADEGYPMHSICEPSLAPAMGAIGERILGSLAL